MHAIRIEIEPTLIIKVRKVLPSPCNILLNVVVIYKNGQIKLKPTMNFPAIVLSNNISPASFQKTGE